MVQTQCSRKSGPCQRLSSSYKQNCRYTLTLNHHSLTHIHPRITLTYLPPKNPSANRDKNGHYLPTCLRPILGHRNQTGANVQLCLLLCPDGSETAKGHLQPRVRAHANTHAQHTHKPRNAHNHAERWWTRCRRSTIFSANTRRCSRRSKLGLL